MLPLLTTLGLLLVVLLTMTPHAAAATSTSTTASDGSCSAASKVRTAALGSAQMKSGLSVWHDMVAGPVRACTGAGIHGSASDTKYSVLTDI